MPFFETTLIKQCLISSWKEEAPFPEILKLACQGIFAPKQFPILGSANTFYKVLVVKILSFVDNTVSTITTQCYCYVKKGATDNI